MPIEAGPRSKTVDADGNVTVAALRKRMWKSLTPAVAHDVGPHPGGRRPLPADGLHARRATSCTSSPSAWACYDEAPADQAGSDAGRVAHADRHRD